jgi:hypothetical protein
MIVVKRITTAIFFSVMFFVGAFSLEARAATCTVNDLTDTAPFAGGAGSGGASGTGDLRYCLTQTEANPGADTINFTATGTINIAVDMPTTTQDLTINVNGSVVHGGPISTKALSIASGNVVVNNLTIDGAVVNVTGNASATLTLNSVTIQNGANPVQCVGSGGKPSLNISHSAVLSNQVNLFAPSPSSAIDANNCNLSMTSVRLSFNSGKPTLAVENFSTAKIENSEFDNNENGVVILSTHATALMSNVTITDNNPNSGNTASVGAVSISSGTSATLRNCTIAGNFTGNQPSSGGITNNGQLTIANTIVAYNTGNTVGSIQAKDFYGGVNAFTTKLGANIIMNMDDFGTETGTGTISTADPQLNGLANNGGFTNTRKLQSTSPARDTGVNAEALDTNGSPLTSDQRGGGFSRITGTKVDIGAFEFGSFQPTAASGSVSGTITDASGAPVSGTTINLSGAQTRETITDANGNYGFDGVETNGFYTVTPSRANYNFSPPSRSFSLLGVHTEASFTAAPNGDHGNAIDTIEFFVRQQYLDFLGREPDPQGFDGWVNTLRNCAPGDTSCDRIHVSESFYRSPEFQERGYFVYRFYSSAFGRKPDYGEFTPDVARVSGFLTNGQLEAARTAFANDFVTRPAFSAQYGSLNNSAYVDALINTAQVNLMNRQALIDGLNAGTLTRGAVLEQIAESAEVYQKYYNQAFVVMEYFGYLRRDPDGLSANWIQVLDANPADSRHMVDGFVNALEYRNRFAQ